VSVYIIRVHCPYYIIGLDTFYGLARIKNGIKVKYKEKS
jgi:hypothetical protein